MSRDARRIPVAIVTGFLGSGKTTLLSRVLGHPAMANTAVIINEFGEISIDHLLVARSTEHVIELRNGCLCCTIRGDLAMTLRDLHRQRLLGDLPPFDYVVIETSGLADPVPLLHTLMETPALKGAFAVDALVACADALHLEATLAGHDCAESQLAIADLVLLTKVDLIDDGARERLLARLRSLNPNAEVVPLVHGEIEPGRLFRRDLFTAAACARPRPAAVGLCDASGGHEHDHDHGRHYDRHVVTADTPLSLAGMSVFLNRLVNEQRDRLLRIKGLAAFAGRGSTPGVIHAVRDKFYPIQWLEAWPDGDRSSRLVFIGKALDHARIDAEFDRLCR
jgi:G3E family GTPase